MGRDWLYKLAGDGGKPSSATKKKAGKSRKAERHPPPAAASSSSCMNAIFHLFDIHRHQFPFQQPPFISDNPQEHKHVLKGVEAPRNSLEVEQPMVEVASSSSSSSKIKNGTNLDIPTGGIQIKTTRTRLMDDLSSECSTSPGTKTPNLLARLMGLDLLPENSSPRPSSSSNYSTPLNPVVSKLSSHKNHTRSLPVTPRTSTASRRSTESDHRHRFSLEINKENCHHCCRPHEDESTGEYAKKIVKEVRERISRRVGVDITNTSILKQKEERRDENLILLKPRKPPSPPPSAAVRKDEPIPTGTTLSGSPRLRLAEIKNNLNKPLSDTPKTSSSSSSLLSKSNTAGQQPPLMKQQQAPSKKPVVRKMERERYDLRLKTKNPQDEAFVKSKKACKKSTPLSGKIVNNVNGTTKFLTSKNVVMASPSSTPTFPQKQVSLQSIITQLPSCQRRSYFTTPTHQDNVTTPNGVAAPTTTAHGGSVSDHLHQYISRILKHLGIDKNIPISITQWYSPSHPLHPSIFHHLEKHFHPTTTATAVAAAADRKLVFEFVDELLAEILKPYLSFRPWAGGVGLMGPRMCGSELAGKLYERIGSFPAADCRVLEDIDELIGGDMRRSTAAAADEEVEEVAREIADDMVDTLVHEMTWQR